MSPTWNQQFVKSRIRSAAVMHLREKQKCERSLTTWKCSGSKWSVLKNLWMSKLQRFSPVKLKC